MSATTRAKARPGLEAAVRRHRLDRRMADAAEEAADALEEYRRRYEETRGDRRKFWGESASEVVDRLLPDLSTAERVRVLRAAADLAVARGLDLRSG